MTPQDGDAESQRVLEQLLRDHAAGSYKLPPLAPGADPFKSLKKLLHQISDGIESFLRSIFRDKGGFEVSDSVFEALKIAAWIAIAAVVAIGIYQLVRFLAPYVRRVQLRAAKAAAAPLPVKEAIDDELAAAESKGEYARALRLRWRLFLRRKAFSPASTPIEVVAAPPLRSPELSAALNAGMFDLLERSDRDLYLELKRSVAELEGEPR